MSNSVKLNNLDYNYQQLLGDILDNGRVKGDRTGTGTISVFGREIRHKCDEGFALLTTKKMFLRGIAVELEWFLQGGTNIKYLVDKNVHIWDKDAYRNYCGIMKREGEEPLKLEDYIATVKNDESFARRYANLGPIYGHQWRNAGGDWTSADGLRTYMHGGRGLDQLAAAVKELQVNPDNRRIKVDAWAPKEIQYMALPPCHTDFQLYSVELSLKERSNIYWSLHPDWVVAGEHEFYDQHKIPRRGLYLKWQQRSVDTFLGLPFNIASYALLLEVIAKQLQMQPMEVIGTLGDTHIYLNHIDQCKEQISRFRYDLPTLNLETSATIDNFDYSMLKLNNYQSHPPLHGEMNT